MALYIFFYITLIDLKVSSPLLLLVAGQHRFVFSDLLLTSLSMMSGSHYSQLPPPFPNSSESLLAVYHSFMLHTFATDTSHGVITYENMFSLSCS